MVYDRGKSHSSPSYSHSYNYTREKTPEEKQQEERKRKEHEQQREFEEQVKTAVKLPPTQVKELIEGKIATKRELWYLFLDNLSSQYNSEVVAIVASAVSDDTLSFDKLIASGVSTDVAVEIYKNWNPLWGDTISQVATTSQLQKPEGELKTNSDIEAKQTDNKSLKASETIKEPTQQQQQTYQEDSLEVAFLPAIPVAVIGGFVLVAAGASLLLQVEDENGELVTVNEYASRPIAELLEAISNDIKNYYQTGDEIAQIKKWVAPALEKIVVTEEPENQVYTTPLGERGTIEHTGSVPPKVSTGTPGFDTEAGRETVEGQQHTGHEVSTEVDWDNYIFESEKFDTQKIPGIHVPFRDYDPKHPPNWTLSEAAQNTDYKERNYDCSEIADELLKAAGGKGRIIEVTPAEGDLLKLYEFGKTTRKDYHYHQVYTDGRYVYDPRLDKDKPIPKGDWEKLMRGLNPGSNFKYLK